MQNKHDPKNLRKLTGQDVTADAVLHSTVYGQAASTGSSSLPTNRRITPIVRQHIQSYRDSMVGSTIQYRTKVPDRPKESESKIAPTPEDTGVGNRQKGGVTDKSQADAKSIERRHHFIEPPQRGFNRFS